MKECVIHGSPRTVLDKLVALRERVGPFGTLLQIGLDWGGPNEAWERDGMRLLAHEVMPKFRQHVTAQAAECCGLIARSSERAKPSRAAAAERLMSSTVPTCRVKARVSMDAGSSSRND